MTDKYPTVAVVIPSFKVRQQILGVLAAIGPEVDRIYVIDDKCPEETGKHVEAQCFDTRVQVLYNKANQGVGGATMTGYKQATNDGADILVKLDGDGQMDPALAPKLIGPIAAAEADYTKGNRFFDPEGLREMPRIRLVGNALLSLITKFSTGYWDIFDPTNGFTAIHARVARILPFHKIDKGYFFESDILFRLNTLRAVVVDIPMPARYGDEKSQISIRRESFRFLAKNFINYAKRIFYNYFLRDFNVASVEIVAGLALLAFGTIFGAIRWYAGSKAGVLTSTGTVMLAALPVIVGVQLVLAFLTYDVQNIPRVPLHTRL